MEQQKDTTFWSVPSPGDRRLLICLTLGLTAMLALGFLPTANRAAEYLSRQFGLIHPQSREWLRLAAFPALASLFYVSLPARSRRLEPAPTTPLSWVRVSLLPLLISFLFGLFMPHPPIWTATSRSFPALAWYLFLAPVGEEFLFRGWFYSLVEKLAPGKILTYTNPFPIALWASAFAFSMWHFQNLASDPWGLVLFQVGYTFLAGIWLGFLRWQTGQLRVAILAHVAINLFAALA